MATIMSKPKILVIIPAYNEKENINKTVQAVFSIVPSVHILIVDDNSPDGTGAIADELASKNKKVNVLHRLLKEGLGRAYIAGFRWAIRFSVSKFWSYK